MSLTGVVSLTYDGGSLCHVETVLTQLDSLGVRGTFYVDPVSLLENLPEWGCAVSKGHEIGNGSLFTACLDGWTDEMVVTDVLAAKELIEDLFPEQIQHGIALPWHNNSLVESPLIHSVVSHYNSIKSGICKSHFSHEQSHVFSSYQIDNMDKEEIMNLVEKGLRSEQWITLSFQGIGVGDPGIDAAAHMEVCKQLLCLSGITVLPVTVALTQVLSPQQGIPRLV